MIETKRKEELSKSYLNAICAYKGIAVEIQSHDDDSLDVMVKKILTRKDGVRFNAQIHIQLKATSQHLAGNASSFNFELKLKNYNDLRMLSAAPMMLCVLTLPNDEQEWLSHSVDELILRECMYWLDLSKHPDTDNTSSVTVKIHRENTLTPDKMLNMLQNIAENGSL